MKGSKSQFAFLIIIYNLLLTKNNRTLRLTRIFHETMWRDREDGCATGQPQGVGPEAYLHSTSQGPTSEDARKNGHIRGRSRRFLKYPG
jgi:hypothetical protein